MMMMDSPVKGDSPKASEPSVELMFESSTGARGNLGASSQFDSKKGMNLAGLMKMDVEGGASPEKPVKKKAEKPDISPGYADDFVEEDIVEDIIEEDFDFETFDDDMENIAL